MTIPRSKTIWGRPPSNVSALRLGSIELCNLLKDHGWIRGEGYQPGEPNFSAIQGWNAASVYQSAIAIIGKQIDE